MSTLSQFLVTPLAGVSKADDNTLQLSRPQPELRLVATDTTGGGASAPIARLRNVNQANGAGPNVYLEGTNDAAAVKTLFRAQGAFIDVTAGAEKSKFTMTVLKGGANAALDMRGDTTATFGPTAAGGFALGTSALPWLEAWVGNTGGTKTLKVTSTGPGSENALITENSALVIYNGALATYSLGATALTMKGAGTFAHTIYAGTDVANTNFLTTTVATTGVTLNSTKAGTGTTQALTVQMDGTRNMLVDTNGDVAIGKTGLATGNTSGFLYIPSVAGVMTGVPTARAGFVPIYYDSTNNKIGVYVGGAWKHTASLA